LDHVGPFAASTADLAACYDALQGYDPGDAACVERAVEPIGAPTRARIARVARLTGYFDRYASEEARTASRRAAAALGALDEVELPEVHRARAAAFIMTASEGGERHLDTLKRFYDDFEPLSRDRLVAGALTPAAWYVKAQRLRTWFRDQLEKVFARFDLLIAPATPVSATPIGSEWLHLGGESLPLRASMGMLTQPISFAGLPVISAPIDGNMLPLGVQLIAPPWREDICFAAAAMLEAAGVARARIAAH
jgi:aspartyl-tRNA(Asn)/glutamyl-tRNA(Gln) amidotransferase subunit A